VPGSPGSAADGTWGYTPAQQLYDDGLHGDGAANDGVYGAWVVTNTLPGYHEFKIANADWSFGEPTVPEAPLINGRLYTSVPGEVVHFRLDLNNGTAGWMPDVAVANDHGYPAGMHLELIGSAPELGSWNFGLSLDHSGGVWSRTVIIAMPGYYEYKYRVEGSWNWANFGLNYNNNFGYNAYVFTTMWNEPVRFEFDEVTGRMRAVLDQATPARRSTWGGVKASYR